MKTEIHPKYETTTIACVCGEIFHIRSTSDNLKVGICFKCHPFYTGKSKHIDTEGRLERFKKKYGDGYKKSKKAAKEEEKSN